MVTAPGLEPGSVQDYGFESRHPHRLMTLYLRLPLWIVYTHFVQSKGFAFAIIAGLATQYPRVRSTT